MKREKPQSKKRIAGLAILLAVIFAVYTVRIADMQLIHSEKWLSEANPQNIRTSAVKAPRGEIVDRYGRPFAVNREGYDIILDGAALSSKTTNTVIRSLVTLLTETGEDWRDELPVSKTEPYSFTADNGKEAAALRKKLELNTYATAENCVARMVERYNLRDFSAEQRRILMGIRYTMELDDFSVVTNYTFAEDIKKETTLRIKENPKDLTGADIEIVPVREYIEPDVAPHITGTVDPISAETWADSAKRETLKSSGYTFNDKMGSFGVELSAEDYLRGQDGVKTIVLNASGQVVSSEITKTPVAGNTVILTIDRDLQRVCQDSLVKIIREVKAESPLANGGAVVVTNVNTGEVLAAATYPTYTLTQYKEDISSITDLNNRAFMTGYPPGSTFKPAMAAIGLQAGVITPTDSIRCVQSFTKYAGPGGRPFTCMGRHGNISLNSALAQSCNYFFYETGDRLGIKIMNQYCRLLGLGVKTGTGIEESAGILSGPEYANFKGLTWVVGDTIQAAIGQGYNAITPIQLATYTATLANGGTRYQTSVIREIKTYGLDETVKAFETVVAAESTISKVNIDAVKRGMRSVTEDGGTARRAFSGYTIEVGGKTGTAQNDKGADHGVFIGFAPFENPEIAISIVVEHGLHGSTVSKIARDIFDEYFLKAPALHTETPVGTLLQ